MVDCVRAVVQLEVKRKKHCWLACRHVCVDNIQIVTRAAAGEESIQIVRSSNKGCHKN
jgi:hypothetical protein